MVKLIYRKNVCLPACLPKPRPIWDCSCSWQNPANVVVLWVMVPGTSPVVYNKKGA